MKTSSAAGNSADKRHGIWLLLSTGFEGRLLLAGLILAVILVLFAAATWLVDHESGYHVSVMTVYHLMLGRAAGISYGHTAGMGTAWVILANMYIETVILLVLFPLFVLSWRKLLVVDWLRRLTEPARLGAESHRGLIRKVGVPGLFIFVWFPFWMTGPLVGAIIGFMLGIRPWVNLSVVLAGTYIAIATWGLVLKDLYERLAAFAPYAPLVVLLLLTAIMVTGRVIGSREIK